MGPEALAFEPDSATGVHDEGGGALAVFLRYHGGEEAPGEMLMELGCSPHSVVDDGLDFGAAAGVVELVLPGVLQCRAGVPVGGVIQSVVTAQGATLVRQLGVGCKVDMRSSCGGKEVSASSSGEKG